MKGGTVDCLMYQNHMKRYHMFRVLDTNIMNVHFKWLADKDYLKGIMAADFKFLNAYDEDYLNKLSKKANADVFHLKDLLNRTIPTIQNNINRLFDNTDIVIGDFNYSSQVLQKIFNTTKYNPVQIGRSLKGDGKDDRDDCICITKKDDFQETAGGELTDTSYISTAEEIIQAFSNNRDTPLFDHDPVTRKITKKSDPEFELITINIGATYPTTYSKTNMSIEKKIEFSKWHCIHVISFLEKNILTKKTNYVVCLQEVDKYMYEEFKRQFELPTHISDFHMYFQYYHKEDGVRESWRGKNVRANALKDVLNKLQEMDKAEATTHLSYGLFSFSNCPITDNYGLK